MNGKVLLIICVATMVLLTIKRREKYNISKIKYIPMTVCVAIVGLLGTDIMYFIENCVWGGISFFGAVLFFPILLIPISLIFKIELKDLLDYATPAGLALLAPFKLNCYYNGCCEGKVLGFSEEGIPTYFPSQFAEMGVAIILVVVLLVMERNPKFKGEVYPWCLVLYGISRYVLNHYRWDQNDFLFGLPAGNFWSIVSIMIGIVWLVIKNGKSYKKREII